MEADDYDENNTGGVAGSFIGCMVMCTIAVLAMTLLVLACKALAWAYNL